ncbi:MAG TPA: hypothetical protein EYP53_01475 [Candidatus Latescibacteria bacterium]|nr:hypothetical protein [Candidatus Latescibacterota bacterium]
MSSGTFKLPTDEFRFTSEHISIGEGRKLYIDPSIWCIHGEYEAFDKYIVTRSNVTAHLVQVHPFTLGWIADLHSGLNLPDNVREQIDRLSLCNPTVTVFGGDIVRGSGEYSGSDMEDSWFQSVWEYAKDRLSNQLWLKGNHDIDPNRDCYYNWFERLWVLKVGRFKFVAFDGYNEQTLCPGSCYPCLSLPDILWLARRLREDDLEKVILVHQPLDQWCVYCPWVFREANITCAYAGHSHDIIYAQGPYKEIAGIPDYINGSCSEEVQLRVATLTLFAGDGKERSVLVEGGIGMREGGDEIEITTPVTVNWKKEKVTSVVPIRLARRISGHYVNLIACLPSEDRGSVRIKSTLRGAKITGDVEMYVIGKDIYSEESLYDSWVCSCGAMWNSYRAMPGRAVELELLRS